MRITRCVSKRFVHFAIIAIPIIPVRTYYTYTTISIRIYMDIY